MPTWYRAPSAPAANRPAHGTPQQAPGGGTAAHASSRRTGRQGFRFREKWEQSANNPLPTSPENGTGFSANPTELQIFFPVLANLELHDTCPPRNLIRQFPHRSKTAFLASASFPVRNISAPSVPQAPPQPTARRPVHGSETAAHASGDRPVRGRRAPDAPHFAPMLRVSGVVRKRAPQFLRVSGVMRTECPRACRFSGLCEKPNSHNPENSRTPSPHADSGKLSPRYILHSLTRNLFRCRRFHASTSNAGIVRPLGIQ